MGELKKLNNYLNIKKYFPDAENRPIDTIKKDKPKKNVVYLYPCLKLMTFHTYNNLLFKNEYVLLKKYNGFYKVGFFATKEFINAGKCKKATGKDAQLIFKYLDKNDGI